MANHRRSLIGVLCCSVERFEVQATNQMSALKIGKPVVKKWTRYILEQERLTYMVTRMTYLVHSCDVGIIGKMSSQLGNFIRVPPRQKFWYTLCRVGIIHTEIRRFLWRRHLCCSFCAFIALSASSPAELQLNTVRLSKYRCFFVLFFMKHSYVLNYSYIMAHLIRFLCFLLSHKYWASMLFLHSNLKAHEHTESEVNSGNGTVRGARERVTNSCFSVT